MVLGILFSLQNNILNVTSAAHSASDYSGEILLDNFLEQPSTSSTTLASIFMSKRDATTTFVLGMSFFNFF